MHYFTGFADEAGSSIEQQIKATKALGWKYIESRNIDGVNIHNLPEDRFETVAGQLADAGIAINCFGSEVANWGKDPFKEDDFLLSVEMLKRAIVRMHKLGTKMIRGMSFAMQKQLPPDDKDVEVQVLKKVAYLVNICEDAGIIYAHENCMNYGGQSPQHTLRLVEKINSPNFKLIFDTGNPVFTDLRLGKPPYQKQNSWDFYRQVRDFIYYVHIKDAIFQCETGDIFPKSTFTWPGEGNGNVRKIVGDLLQHGYNGGFSIEPHVASVFHEQTPDSDLEKVKYDSYIEYGRRLMQLVADCQP